MIRPVSYIILARIFRDHSRIFNYSDEDSQKMTFLEQELAGYDYDKLNPDEPHDQALVHQLEMTIDLQLLEIITRLRHSISAFITRSRDVQPRARMGTSKKFMPSTKKQVIE